MYNNVDDLSATLQNAFVFVFLAFHINYFYNLWEEYISSMKYQYISKYDKSYDDSVKLKRTEMDPFRLG